MSSDDVAAREEARLMRSFQKQKSRQKTFGSPVAKAKPAKTAEAVEPADEAAPAQVQVDDEEAAARRAAIDAAVIERERRQEEERAAAAAAEHSLARSAASMGSFGSTGTKLNVVDGPAVKQALSRLHDVSHATNWVLLGYGEGKNNVVLVGEGDDGLDGLRARFAPDCILFAIVSQTMKSVGDAYVRPKFGVITWIGSAITAGMAKARAAGHRAELVTFVSDEVSISGELQLSGDADELSRAAVAQALGFSLATQSSSSASTSTSAPSSPIVARSGARGGRGIQRVEFVDDAAITAALERVHSGDQDWLVLAMAGTRVAVQATGTGACAELRALFPTAGQILFAVLQLTAASVATSAEWQSGPEGDTELRKVAIVTMVGPRVKPLHKARVSGFKDTIASRVKQVMPFHAHFQPNDVEDLVDDAILRKLGLHQ